MLNLRNGLVLEFLRYLAFALFDSLAHMSEHSFLLLDVLHVLGKHILDEVKVLVKRAGRVIRRVLNADIFFIGTAHYIQIVLSRGTRPFFI